jgi:hypothetical protein
MKITLDPDFILMVLLETRVNMGGTITATVLLKLQRASQLRGIRRSHQLVQEIRDDTQIELLMVK